MSVPFLKQVVVNPEAAFDERRFPFNLPFVKELELRFRTPVTFFVGENGSGKSTVLEAIAALSHLPITGGSSNELAERLGPEESSELAGVLRAGFARRPRDGYFFRAELQANFASLLDRRVKDPDFLGDPYSRYGGESLHAKSHGEAFLSVIENRFTSGLFLLDEPESALSPQRQLVLLALMHALTSGGKSQFIVATHSPVLLTYPRAEIISFDRDPLEAVSLEETSHYQITRGILENPEMYWKHLRGEG